MCFTAKQGLTRLADPSGESTAAALLQSPKELTIVSCVGEDKRAMLEDCAPFLFECTHTARWLISWASRPLGLEESRLIFGETSMSSEPTQTGFLNNHLSDRT